MNPLLVVPLTLLVIRGLTGRPSLAFVVASPFVVLAAVAFVVLAAWAG